jgi:3',5'-cyclic AMP phosphodiesterase CpdA
MSDAFTVILRFRDLVTGPGETIKRHKEIASPPESVWWGWWNKHGETIPDESFRRLCTQAKSEEGLWLILFDSGRLKGFRCLCKDLRWDVSHQKFNTPDSNRTPEYYKDTQYLAWFSLSGFEEIDEQELQAYSYQQVDAFFLEKVSRFNPFYDKRVHGFEELKQQDRTIWFVRPFQPGDHTHQIELMDAAQIRPTDFPEHFLQTQSRRLLWVSDPHFGDHHGFSVEPSNYKNSLAVAMRRALEDHDLTDYAGLLISGDLTWRADPKEFDLARNFISELSTAPSSLDNQAILVCPGNHDLAFTETPEDKGAKIHDREAPEEARAAFADFYEQLYFKQPNTFLSCGRKYLMGGLAPVEVVSLNSSFLEQKEGWFQGHGFIGDDQLRDAAEQMGWKTAGTDHPFRVVMLHHHLMPVTYRDTPTGGYPYSVVIDAEALVRWIVEHRVSLVLHGHMHRSFIARVSRPLDEQSLDGPWHTFHVAGLSSTGVARAEEPNSFASLTVGKNKVTIDWYSIHPTQQSECLRSLTISLEAPS